MNTERDKLLGRLSKDLRILWVAPIVFLIVALAPWPYGYYALLRLAVCGASIWLAFNLINSRVLSGLGWAFVGLALLYNPVFKIHFERDVWMVLNLASAIPFAIVGWASKRHR